MLNRKTHLISSVFRAYCFSSRKWNVLNSDVNITSKRYCSSDSYYDTLNVPRNASQNQIRAAYFRLSKKYHPDVNKNPDAKLKFTKISEAYMTLSNAGERKEYDNRTATSTYSKRATADDFAAHQEFVYKEFTSFKRKKTTGTYYSGRTPHFDFDEHYRMHYEELVKQQHQDKKQREKFEETRKRHITDESGRQTIHLIILLSILSFFMYAGQK